ncbi:MAG: hypothetical protein EAZ15_10660 [Sphingobacteriales bacterium]|nr:MAG: hypothetical protein EAZ15_10660 [Sphingobacteriales bacterium]
MKYLYFLKVFFTALFLIISPKLFAQQPVGANGSNPLQVVLTRGITYTNTQKTTQLIILVMILGNLATIFIISLL